MRSFVTVLCMHRVSKSLVLVAGLVAFGLAAAIALSIMLWTIDKTEEGAHQSQIESFYQVDAAQVSGPPGSIIRTEAMALPKLEHATVNRVLYRTMSSDGQPRVSSAMIFIPTSPAPADGRRVVAWAHPTLGMGPACAPSRSSDPLLDMSFVQGMINNKWVVTATDYAGVGTEGTGRYLVGADEANDVAYSVVMAHNIPDAATSRQWAVYGHSQGGHSALWTGELGNKILPDYKLVATAAAAPAAELVPLISQQWNKPPAWTIGPNFIVGWTSKYPTLRTQGLLTTEGEQDYQSLANECVVQAALEARVRTFEGKTLFSQDPLSNRQWLKIAEEQTPPPLPATMPVYIAQGTADNLVLPNTQALLYEKWCRAGSSLTMQWLDGAGHMAAASLSGTTVTQFFQAHFEGRPSTNTCGLTPPVTPYGG